MTRVLSLLSLVFIFCTFSVSAQVETTIKVNGEDRPALSREINATVKEIADALTDYFKVNGNKKLKKSKGLYVVNNINVNEITTDNLDLFFGIDVKGKKRDKVSTISIAVHTSNPQFVGQGTHEQIKQNLPAFLNKIPQIITDYEKKLEAERLQKEADAAKKEQEKLEKKAAKQAAKAAKIQAKADKAKEQ